ncbi:MAG: hypothetical protein GYA24_22265 [Candidatus Lokiarchaeota archaeon]|nr:hypothetical protein [Candidatus Lokiarchaeota archaeon]
MKRHTCKHLARHLSILAACALVATLFSTTATGYTSKEFTIDKTEQKSFKFTIDAGERFQFSFDANATMDMTVYRVATNGSKTPVASVSDATGEFITTEVATWTCNVTLVVNPGYAGNKVNLAVRYTFMATAGRWLSVVVSIGAAAIGITAIVMLVQKKGPAAGTTGGAG